MDSEFALLCAAAAGFGDSLFCACVVGVGLMMLRGDSSGLAWRSSALGSGFESGAICVVSAARGEVVMTVKSSAVAS